jgi:hypothetical protein
MQRGADIEGTPYWIECKIGAKPDIFEAWNQCIHDRQKKDDKRPILVIVHKDGSGRVIAPIEGVFMDMGTFLSLARRAYLTETEAFYEAAWNMLQKHHTVIGKAVKEAERKRDASIGQNGYLFWDGVVRLLGSL